MTIVEKLVYRLQIPHMLKAKTKLQMLEEDQYKEERMRLRSELAAE